MRRIPMRPTTFRLPFAPVLALAAVASFGAGALAQGKKEMASEPYKDTRWGFEFTPFDKWALTPAQPDDRYMIVSFQSTMGAIDPKLGIEYPCIIEVLRFDPTGRSAALMDQGKKDEKGDGPKTGDGEKPEIKKAEDDTAYKTYEAYINKRFKGIQMKGKPEKIKAGKLDAVLHRFQTVTGTKTMMQYYAVVFTHPEDKSQICLEYGMPEFKFEEWKDWFKRSSESFKFTKRTNDNPDRFNGLSPIAADRLRHKEDCERTGWKFAETPHFFIKYNVAKEDFIKDLKERIEAIRKEYVKFYGDKEMTEIPVLRLTKDFDEYGRYGGPPGSGGYWNSEVKELVVPCFKELNINFTWAVLNHEGFHQFIYYRCGMVAPHSWYNEGTGDYYAGFKYQGANRFELKTLGAWLGGLDRLSTIKEAVKKNSYVPLEKIFRYTQQDYYSKADLCYAEGWSIIYFLREAKKLGHTPWKPEWGGILPEYEKVLFETKDPQKAVESALRDIKGDKMTELENSWKEFVRKLD